MKTRIGLQTFKSLLVAGEMQAAINVLEESDRHCSNRFSNQDCLQIVSSYGLILLLHLMVRIATKKASCAGEVNLRIATLAIQRKMVQAELLDRTKLRQSLASVYLEAVLLAGRELAQDGYNAAELLQNLDREDVLVQAIGLILA